jgi:hypothetical protein
MNRTLLQRVRITRPSAARTSWGRHAGPAPDAERHMSATGHGSRMPSQQTTTRMQRPY